MFGTGMATPQVAQNLAAGVFKWSLAQRVSPCDGPCPPCPKSVLAKLMAIPSPLMRHIGAEYGCFLVSNSWRISADQRTRILGSFYGQASAGARAGRPIC